MISKKIFKTNLLAILSASTTILTSMQPAFAKENSKAITKNLKNGVESTMTIPTSNNSNKEIASITSSEENIPSKVIWGTVFDGDDRVKVSDTTVNPYNAICYAEAKFPDGSTQRGTAWLYKGDTAGTCGHLLYNTEFGGWATTVTLWPGRDRNNAPFGSVSSQTLTVANEWKNDSDRNYDWGIIKLNSKIGTRDHRLSSVSDLPYDVRPSTGHLMTIAGYPADKGSAIEMYKSSGYITDYDDYRIDYKIDMMPGESGSPIFYENTTGKGTKYWTVVGINTTQTSSINHGVRVSEDFRNLLDEIYEK